MKWTKDKSIVLTQLCVAAFSVALLLLDLFAFRIVSWYTVLRGINGLHPQLEFILTVYLCSIFAWIFLYHMWKLLLCISQGEVFTAENIRHLRTVSWCCAGEAVICILNVLYWLSVNYLTFMIVPFMILAAAAVFMMLIVRIVKNVFQTAFEMKSELDLTI